MALAREAPRFPAMFSASAEGVLPRPPTPPRAGRARRRCAAATRVTRSARLAWFGAIGLATVIAGCEPYVEGNGVYREEDRTPAETFTGVHVEDGITAVVTSGAALQKVVVSGDANIVHDQMRTEVLTDHGSGPVLHVRMRTDNLSPDIPPRVVVELGELRYVAAWDEKSHVSASGVATLLFWVEAHGKGEVLLSGPGGGRIEVVASDARIEAGYYPVSEGALVDLSSSSRVTLNSDGPVAGTVGAQCTLTNLGSGSCQGVTSDPTASVCVPVP